VIVFWPPSVFKCTDFLIFFERVLCSVTPGGGASLAVDPPGHLQEAGHFFEGGGRSSQQVCGTLQTHRSVTGDLESL